MYVKRDASGRIAQVSRDKTPECNEYVMAGSPALVAFLVDEEMGHDEASLQTSDLAFVRVLEDVIGLLMDKGVINFTELPEAAQEKMMARQSLRRRLNGLGLVGDGDEEDGVI